MAVPRIHDPLLGQRWTPPPVNWRQEEEERARRERLEQLEREAQSPAAEEIPSPGIEPVTPAWSSTQLRGART